MATHTLFLPHFNPTPLNAFMRGTLKQRMRLARGDAEIIAYFANEQAVPKATGKRRVSLLVTLGPRQREPDCDSPWKGLLDGLCRCGLLVSDRVSGCQLGDLTFARGDRQTTITLEDVED